MTIKPAIERTEDGSQTLRHPHNGETYHSSRGAVGESMHVYIINGLEFAVARFKDKLAGGEPLHIYEVGFGSGLNAWLTLDYACGSNTKIEYTAIELYPVATETTEQLNYTTDPRFMMLHTAPWHVRTGICDMFSIRKINGDFTRMDIEGPMDLVYFDAFAPDVQPELWTGERFAAVYNAMTSGDVLVTYSAKGSVKQNLRDAGFHVRRLPGALGKRHMLRAEK